METLSLSFVLQVLVPAATVYAAIRADLAAMKVRLTHLERKAFGKGME